MVGLLREKSFFPVLLTGLILTACHHQVQDYSFRHHWQTPASGGFDEVFTETRIRFQGHRARWENDFELVLLDLARHRTLEVRRLSRTLLETPFLPEPACAPLEEILARRRCQIHHGEGPQPLTLLCRHTDYEWEFLGRKAPPPQALLQALFQMEVLPDEAFCLLRDYPFCFQHLKIADRRTGHLEAVELDLAAQRQSPAVPGLFVPPPDFKTVPASIKSDQKQ